MAAMRAPIETTLDGFLAVQSYLKEVRKSTGEIVELEEAIGARLLSSKCTTADDPILKRIAILYSEHTHQVKKFTELQSRVKKVADLNDADVLLRIQKVSKKIEKHLGKQKVSLARLPNLLKTFNMFIECSQSMAIPTQHEVGRFQRLVEQFISENSGLSDEIFSALLLFHKGLGHAFLAYEEELMQVRRREGKTYATGKQLPVPLTERFIALQAEIKELESQPSSHRVESHLKGLREERSDIEQFLRHKLNKLDELMAVIEGHAVLSYTGKCINQAWLKTLLNADESFSEEIRKIILSKMPEEIRTAIYLGIFKEAEAAGEDASDLRFGESHCFDDYLRLAKVLAPLIKVSNP